MLLSGKFLNRRFVSLAASSVLLMILVGCAHLPPLLQPGYAPVATSYAPVANDCSINYCQSAAVPANCTTSPCLPAAANCQTAQCPPAAAPATTPVAGVGVAMDDRYLPLIVTGSGVEPMAGTTQQKMLLAKRAATQDAYRNLSERVAGLLLESYTRQNDFTVSTDRIMSETSSYLRGARVMDVTYADGVATATVKILLDRQRFDWVDHYVGEVGEVCKGCVGNIAQKYSGQKDEAVTN